MARPSCCPLAQSLTRDCPGKRVSWSVIGWEMPWREHDLSWKAEMDPEGEKAGAGQLSTLLASGQLVLSWRGIWAAHGLPEVALRQEEHWTCLVVQWLRLRASTAVGTCSIPGQGTKDPVWRDPKGKRKKKKKRQEEHKRSWKPQKASALVDNLVVDEWPIIQ